MSEEKIPIEEIKRKHEDALLFKSEVEEFVSGIVKERNHEAQEIFNKIADALQNLSTNYSSVPQAFTSGSPIDSQILANLAKEAKQLIADIKNEGGQNTTNHAELAETRIDLYVKANYVKELKAEIKELSAKLSAIRSSANNRGYIQRKRDYLECLEECKTLVAILKNKKELKKATKDEKGKEFIRNYNLLLHSIPKRFIDYLDVQGYRTQSGSLYDRSNIIETIQSLNILHDKQPNKKRTIYLSIAAGILCLFGLFYIYVKYIYTEQPATQTVQEATKPAESNSKSIKIKPIFYSTLQKWKAKGIKVSKQVENKLKANYIQLVTEKASQGIQLTEADLILQFEKWKNQ